MMGSIVRLRDAGTRMTSTAVDLAGSRLAEYRSLLHHQQGTAVIKRGLAVCLSLVLLASLMATPAAALQGDSPGLDVNAEVVQIADEVDEIDSVLFPPAERSPKVAACTVRSAIRAR